MLIVAVGRALAQVIKDFRHNDLFTNICRLPSSSLQSYQLPGSLLTSGQPWDPSERQTVGSPSVFHVYLHLFLCTGLITDTSDYSYYGDYTGDYQAGYDGYYGQDQGYGAPYGDPSYLPLVRSLNTGINIGDILQGALDTIVENI